jgi:hypothetical protein
MKGFIKHVLDNQVADNFESKSKYFATFFAASKETQPSKSLGFRSLNFNLSVSWHVSI